MAKGNADCHIPNDRYREGWERVFGGVVRNEKSQGGNKRDLQEKKLTKSKESILVNKRSME